MTASFKLHPRLQQDCIGLGRFELCQLLLMNDSQYPWFILVPEIADIKEIYQLSKTNRQLLAEESNYLSENLAQLYTPDKLNIAAIGNLVPQLHIHHIARYQTDIAWPAPVWGQFNAIPYTQTQLTATTTTIKSQLINLNF